MTHPVTAACGALLLDCEGSRLYTYDDATGRQVGYGEKLRGTLTAGSGHTGPDVIAGMVVTQELADRWRLADLAAAAATVDDAVKVPLGANQFAALTVFVFNIGAGNFRRSTLLRLLNQGNFTAVPAQLARWNLTTIDGRKTVSTGLTARRTREAALFVTPDSQALPVASAEPVAVTRPHLWKSVTAAGAVLAGLSLPLSGELQTAASQIQPLMDYSHAIRHAFVGLSLGGAALSLYGRLAIMRRHGV